MTKKLVCFGYNDHLLSWLPRSRFNRSVQRASTYSTGLLVTHLSCEKKSSGLTGARRLRIFREIKCVCSNFLFKHFIHSCELCIPFNLNLSKRTLILFLSSIHWIWLKIYWFEYSSGSCALSWFRGVWCQICSLY